jgi:hypothetical protein
MAETKYGKHILKDVFKDFEGYVGHSLISHNGEFNVDCCMGYHHVAEDKEFANPHSHNFVELLCFLGSDPADIRDLGAEVEVCLGEEGEKHLIDTAAVVSIPAGLIHCPITIKNVKRPIVFLEVSLTREYGEPVARKNKE